MARREPLQVWLYGCHVATLTSTGAPGDVRCTYTDDAFDRWPSNTPLLSCSMPLTRRRRAPAGVFFKGLLPEGQHLQALAERAKVPTYDTYGMLGRFGRDVAGAIIVTPESPDDRVEGVEPYTSESLADEVAALPENPLALHDDSELSIAGLQNKLLLVKTGKGTWGRPTHGRPSTHILKVEDRRFPGMASFEAASLRLAREVGLTTVDVMTTTIAEMPCIVVSRFDRDVNPDGTVLARVHQEDACQALSRDPEANQRRGKYESAGGPSLAEIATLLDVYAADQVAELTQLVRAITFTAAVGNADAHGKNVALLHRPDGAVELAPLYDTVPTMLWPTLPTRAAMSIGPQTDLAQVVLGDIESEASRWPMSGAAAWQAANEVLEQLDVALGRVDVPEALATFVHSRIASMRR